jgi:cytochrome c
VVAGAHPEAGPAAMRRYGCAACHAIPGVRGADALVGPPLAGFGRRRFIAGREPNEPETLVRWIQNPQAIKPETAMPKTGIPEQAARDVAGYLYTLR